MNEFIDKHFKGIVVVILCLVIGAIQIGYTHYSYTEYNNGVCDCGGSYELAAVYKNFKYYECHDCHNEIRIIKWIS